MIGLDLDGTLLTEKKEILPCTMEILIKMIQKGIHVVIASGRPVSGIPRAAQEIPGIRYALTSNGARIEDLVTGEILYSDLISREKALKVLKIFMDYHTMPEIYKDGQGYICKDQIAHLSEFHKNPYMITYVKETRKRVDDLWEVAKQCTNGMDKVQAMFSDQEERLQARERIEAIPGVKPVTSLGNNIEVNKSSVNKGTGLLKLAEILGIRQEEIMAFGDSDNDLEMIKMAGLGVAMQNAIPEVKEVADYVTQSNEEDGIAKAIERFVL